MTNREAINAILEAIDRAAELREWGLAMARAELLLAAIVQGRDAADAADMEALVDAVGSRATRLVLANDVLTEPSPTACAWLLKAAVAAAEVARRGALQPEDGDTRARIVGRLMSAGAAGLTNVELARTCARSPETISRALRRLRNEGVVAFTSVGRAVRNWIADPAAAAEIADGVIDEAPGTGAAAASSGENQAAPAGQADETAAAAAGPAEGAAAPAREDSSPMASPDLTDLVERNEPPPESNKVSKVIESIP